MPAQRDVIIIGGGAAGLVVASVACQLGLDVVLINRQASMGGDCLHSGCVPSKALLKAASVADSMRHADRWGLSSVEPEVDLSRVMACVKQAIAHLQPHDSRERFESLGCEVITGEARFISRHEVEVDDRVYRAKKIVIATGSSPFIPAVDGLDSVNYLTNESLFDLESLPQSMVVVGGGPVGVEMAQAFSRLGTAVTIIERDQRLLPMLDRSHADVINEQFSREGIEVQTSSEVVRVTHESGRIAVKTGQGQVLKCDALLVASGRRPDVSGLQLERAGVDFDETGIRVNSRMQTSCRDIYACGDVTGVMPLTHVAELQAGIVIANLVFRLPKRIRYNIVPFVVYTSPELATVGISPEQADTNHCQIFEFPMASVDRAVTDAQLAGKAVIVTRGNRIVGASISGARAGELIHEFALAIAKKANVSDIASLVHAYPTYSQLNKRVAGQYYSQKLYSTRTRKLVALLWKILS
jgi:pyruvate/2-oxoglutarate dehydrogenase complex dihydrolipoamide dehydrogenase (E3) component